MKERVRLKQRGKGLVGGSKVEGGSEGEGETKAVRERVRLRQ